MKYINQYISQVDSEIENMFDLQVSNSAFKRVIPGDIMENLRVQYFEYLAKQAEAIKLAEKEDQESRQVSTQVIRVNIAPLREAGYCICPEELAAACEAFIKQNASLPVSTKSSELNNPTEITEIASTINMNYDHETTDDKSDNMSAEFAELECALAPKQKKAYPAKIENGEFNHKRINSDVNERSHQARTKKRKYFTKYMSNEFSKDTKPITMGQMDSKTQQLFRDQAFNELVSEITGMN